jgi:hypothetical protein
MVTVLVGCKSDREEEREVEWAEASRWAAENGVYNLTHLIPVHHADHRCRCSFPRSICSQWR